MQLHNDQVKQNHIALSKFLGYHIDELGNAYMRGSGSQLFLVGNEYFNDWNLLMRVVEKIESDGYTVAIMTFGCTILSKSGNRIIEINVNNTDKNRTFVTKKQATYLACGEFINKLNAEKDGNES